MDKSRDFWTKANRKTVVTRTVISEVSNDSIEWSRLQPMSDVDFGDLQAAKIEGASVWKLRIFYQEGLENEESYHELYATKKSAKTAATKYIPGMEIDVLSFLGPTNLDFDADNLSILTNVSIMGRGETPYQKIFESLEGADVVGSDWKLSRHVVQWLGEQGKIKLVQKFKDSWEAVAALEFCAIHFHRTSLATLAARALVADYVAVGDFDAGYASRELELFYSGAEQLAIQAKTTRKLAGSAGGSTSRARKLANLESVMKEIEKRKGAFGLISEKVIVSEAIKAAQKLPAMPQSKKTLDGYEITLRSEEPFKSRYNAVFGKNA